MGMLRAVDKSVIIAWGFVVLLLATASIVLQTGSFFSSQYLLQQLQIATFLGIVASGAMVVILLGHIDLSIPWIVTVGGMMSTAAAGWWDPALAVPFGLLAGLAFGVLNGVGVAFLRIPSMIFTLGVNTVAQGLMVLHTGGFAPQDHATDLMHFLAVGRTVGNIPNAVFVWVLVGLLIVFMLRYTPLGRYIYAIGNKEGATYLSGVDTRLVIIGCFAISGVCSALAGIMLAGHTTKAYQAMGDPFLLPAIAAVVLGGTNILGGRGTYAGTIAGVILITILQSILAVMQMPEAGRQVIFGVVIVVMLLVYGRGQRVQG